MVLNSPWFDMQGSILDAHARHRRSSCRSAPGSRCGAIPRKVSGLYARSLHRDHEGEFDFNLDWKPVQSWPVYAGWLRAIRTGHAELHRGIEVGCPVLVLTSGATRCPTEMGDDVHGHDIVLEVEQIRRWATVGRPARHAGQHRGRPP